jgi:hypothetical protein
MYIGIIGILYHDVGIAMGIPYYEFLRTCVRIAFWVFVQ